MDTVRTPVDGDDLVALLAGSGKLPALVSDVTAAIMQFQEATDAIDEAAGKYIGLGRTEMRCLSILLHGPRSASALADETALTRGAVTALIDRLEVKGLVARHGVDSDRRRVAVALKPLALRQAAALYGPPAAEGFEQLGRYSDAELRLIAGFLGDSRDLQMRHAARMRAMARDKATG